MDRFATLPEDCLFKILSLTSPLDAARSSVISKGFKLAADSDILWETFLPSDIPDIILRSRSSFVYATSTKKELYMRLCDSPLILDDEKMQVSLDKRSGKKCYLIAARKLIICWGENPQCWTWIRSYYSGYSEVAKLEWVRWLDIRGRLRIKRLSSRTNYTAHLVFALSGIISGLEVANSVIRFVNHETDGDAERTVSTLRLWPLVNLENVRREISGELPRPRADGWWEVELGTFYNDQGDDDDEVEARLIETHGHPKCGLIVGAIEFRPH